MTCIYRDKIWKGISNKSLVSTMEWNFNCFDKAHHSQLVEAKRSLKIELDVEGQGQD